MKKLFLFSLVFLSLLFVGCKEKPQQWEYAILPIEGMFPGPQLPRMKGHRTSSPMYKASNMEIGNPLESTERTLNGYGEMGWELVGITSEIETVFPNFGDEEYVTGIKPNTRTFGMVYVFKRPKQDKSEEEK